MVERNKAALIPYVIEDTGRGERSMDIYSRLLKDRIIFIGTEIDDQVANAVVAQLIFLRADDPKKDINIYINSPGGVISAGLAIYDTMQYMKCKVNTYCIGLAASMAAVIMCAGTKGCRFILPNSRIMLHQPHGGVTGTSADIHIQAQEILRMKKQNGEIVAKHTGQPFEKVMEDTERDFYMSPQESLDYGLVDKILSADDA